MYIAKNALLIHMDSKLELQLHIQLVNFESNRYRYIYIYIYMPSCIWQYLCTCIWAFAQSLQTRLEMPHAACGETIQLNL